MIISPITTPAPVRNPGIVPPWLQPITPPQPAALQEETPVVPLPAPITVPVTGRPGSPVQVPLPWPTPDVF